MATTDHGRAEGIEDDMELVEPDWSEGDVREVLEQLADLAIVVAHHLLDYAGKESMARVSADMLLDFLRTEVAGVLGEQMPPMCTVCGTSGPPAVMNSSRRHQAHLAREKAEQSGSAVSDEQPTAESAHLGPETSGSV